MNNTIDMIFRKVKRGEFKGEVMAFIPPVVCGRIGYYAHIGGHGESDYWYYRDETIPAKPEEYASLLKELDSLYCHSGDGYDYEHINVKRRMRLN